MKANTNYTVKEAELKTRDIGAKAQKRTGNRIWNALTKYVRFEEDAILKDPNWPYLWDHKKKSGQ
ncbi:MAG: hypothetical protein WC749_07595 [Dehalococcoidia bacterium]